MIELSFVGDSDQRVLEFFQGSTPRIIAAIEPALLRAMSDLKTYIQTEKLQGQVLKSHKNGAGLAGSLNVRVESSGLAIAGYVGTALIYARIHEYGYSGSEDVRSYTRMQTMAWGRAMDPPRPVTVRAFTREMVMPARPYMYPSLEEKRDVITQRIRDAILNAIEEA